MREERIEVTRRARYFVEEGAAVVIDVWIVCHGFGELASGFLSGCSALIAPGRRIVAPEALNRFYVKEGTAGSRSDAVVGATWMTKEDRENEIADYVDYLDAVHAAVVPDGARVTVLGFSQGVATVARWAARGKARIDRLVLWAGYLPTDVSPASLGTRLPGGLTLVCGTRDQYADWVSLEAFRATLTGAGVPHEVTMFEGGHRLDDATLRAIGG